MQWAVGQSQFEWLASNKGQQTFFNSYMASRRQGRPMWFDVYPVERLLGNAVPDENTVFLVNVGGNIGHDVSRFRQWFSHLAGRLIVQDLSKVADGAFETRYRD